MSEQHLGPPSERAAPNWTCCLRILRSIFEIFTFVAKNLIFKMKTVRQLHESQASLIGDHLRVILRSNNASIRNTGRQMSICRR
jgi:hypothetical protein